MSEKENAADDYGGASVVRFRARTAVKQSEPYLTDEERLALRRLVGMEERIRQAVRKMELLEHACPTAKREIRALLLDE